MTQKDKELLLKDLSARLLYKTKVCLYEKETCILMGIDGYEVYLDVDSDSFRIESIKPYLRPMSSMTEEEKLHVELTYGFFYHDGVLDNVHIFEVGGTYDRDGNYEPPCEYREERHITIEQVLDFIHWLNAHHFDYRGLIEKGLAIEAPEGMYN